jgi:hypothetical protein
MQYISYLRSEADKYRERAEQSKDPVVRQELLDLASACEEAASRNEELLSGWSLLIASYCDFGRRSAQAK